ncbi:hypothetical protein F5Y19DRAFT_409488 [Xylariaceae sp. FL1651]|nr:hypothetical protein F5Y19DRAFT_409488 [Xylariaceae sp. FL1651]
MNLKLSLPLHSLGIPLLLLFIHTQHPELQYHRRPSPFPNLFTVVLRVRSVVHFKMFRSRYANTTDLGTLRASVYELVYHRHRLRVYKDTRTCYSLQA